MVEPSLPHSRYRWIGLLVIWVALVVAVTSLYAFLQTQGVVLTGDEPHYLIAALALTHFNPHIAWAYQQDFHTHAIYTWPPGAQLSGTAQDFVGPHGIISGHGLGIPLLIFPFIAAGGRNAAMVSFFAIEAAGLIFLHQRMSWLVSLSRPSRWLFALAIGAPALWIAGTQLYPDLISGIFLACALVEVAVIEQTRRLSLIGTLVVAIGVGFTPWFEPKNFLPALIIGVAFIGVVVRRRLPMRSTLLTLALIGVGWILLLSYDQYYFGHLLGLPQSSPGLNGEGVLGVIALLFDRHQGLFIQVPTVAVGLVGLWFARHRVPIAAMATLVAVASILALNGTFVGNPFGGTTLAGRFAWSAFPMLLAWSPYVLKRIDFSRARTIVVAIVISLLWATQAIPIFDGEHYHYSSYYNAMTKPPLWDPSLYPGWWPGLNNLLPDLLPPTNRSRSFQILFGSSGIHLLAAIGSLVIICALLLWLARPESLWPGFAKRLPDVSKVGGVAVGVAGVFLALGLALPNRNLPDRSLQWTGANLGSPFNASGRTVITPDFPLTYGGAGEYTASLSYTLSGNGSPVTLSMLRSPLGQVSPPRWNAASITDLPNGDRTVSATFDLPPSLIGVQIQIGRGHTLIVKQLLLRKQAANSG